MRISQALACVVAATVCSLSSGAGPLLECKTDADLAGAFKLDDGWKVDAGSLVGQSPEYHSLPGSALAGFDDLPWTYFTVHPINLWGYAVAGDATWADYTVQCTVKVEKAAPLKGHRPGSDFFNYQWGREAIGSDAAIVVRYKDADNNYMVRLSTGYGHVELWKTRGGVIRVKDFAFAAAKDYQVAVTASGPWIVVAIDGKEIIRYFDAVEPIAAGKAGLAVRESRVRFSNVTVAPAAAIADAAREHKADFHARRWVGRDYIFDGDEPIAWFGWMGERGMELREVKLRPGLMPLISPHAGMEMYDYTPVTDPNGHLTITEQGKAFGFDVRIGRYGEYEVNSKWRITYEQGRGYVLDKVARLGSPTGRPLPLNPLPASLPAFPAPLSLPPIEDIYCYQICAPVTDKLPRCLVEKNYFVYEADDGKIIGYPNASYFWINGLGRPSYEPIRAGGVAVTTIDGWGAACEFPPDNAHRFYNYQCHWGLDVHMVPLEAPDANDREYSGHVRHFLMDKAQVAAMLQKSVMPKQTKPSPRELFAHVEPVNKFDRLSPGLTGEPIRMWTGKYHVDRATGHGDSICMRIDAGEITLRHEDMWLDERPNLWMGSSYWSGPFLARKYRFSAYVKADDFSGKVILLADAILAPHERKIAACQAETTIKGKADWTKISFETDFPHQAFYWTLRVDAVGKGAIYVDDVAITPVDE